ncbi:MAG: DHHA1 domain-containing protein, partial [Cyclobacteriaceae bacterium]|nr:DHHA1 domain-containing protein [Cyclobacteriaceae bacterium]
NTMIEEKSALEKRLEQLQIVQINAIKESLVAGMTQMGEKNVIISEVELPSADALKKLSFDLKNKVKNLFMILAANIEGKPQIAVMLDDSLVKEGYNANVLIKELAKEINGGGGGQPFFAVAGGKEIKGLPEVVKKAKEIVSEK